MNKRILITTLVIIFLVGTLIITIDLSDSIPANGSKQPSEEKGDSEELLETAGENNDGFGGNFSITLNTQLPEQTRVVKYEVVGKMSEEEARTVAERFGMSEHIVPSENNELLKARDNSEDRYLAVYPEGSVIYHENSKLWGVPEKPLDLPTRDKAIELATNYLKDMDLFPADAEVEKVVSDKYGKKSATTGEIVEEMNVNMQVIFERELNGTPVTGVGSKLKVYVGDEGEVVGIHKVWREVEPAGTMKIKPCREALEDLKQKPSLPPGFDNITINDAQFAYYETGPGVEQKYLEPIWEFKGQAFNDNKTMEIERVIPAT